MLLKKVEQLKVELERRPLVFVDNILEVLRTEQEPKGECGTLLTTLTSLFVERGHRRGT